MQFIDMNDDRVYTTRDLFNDWQSFRAEEPENHAASFAAEMLEIIMATINGRNDLEIIGTTPREISGTIARLRVKVRAEF